jgi:DNA-binding XRE family transcriptional regulator
MRVAPSLVRALRDARGTLLFATGTSPSEPRQRSPFCTPIRGPFSTPIDRFSTVSKLTLGTATAAPLCAAAHGDRAFVPCEMDERAGIGGRAVLTLCECARAIGVVRDRGPGTAAMRDEYAGMCLLCVPHSRSRPYILHMTSAADEIKAWRNNLGWTQEQAAAALGVPVQTIRAWEIGRYLPRHRQMLTLALTHIASEQQKPGRKRRMVREERSS